MESRLMKYFYVYSFFLLLFSFFISHIVLDYSI